MRDILIIAKLKNKTIYFSKCAKTFDFSEKPDVIVWFQKISVPIRSRVIANSKGERGLKSKNLERKV